MIKYDLTWGNCMWSIFWLIVFYFVLLALIEFLKRVQFLGRSQSKVQRIMSNILIIYEPLAIVLGLVTIVLVNPVIHGMVLILILLLAFEPIKNYASGRIFSWTHELKQGQKIKVNKGTGVIKDLGRIGLKLQSKEGTHFVNYSTLLTNGYTLVKGEQMGGLHHLKIRTNVENVNHEQVIRNRLYSCPYVDWTFNPKVEVDTKHDNALKVQLLVKENQHLNYLIQLFKEWGYECSLSL